MNCNFKIEVLIKDPLTISYKNVDVDAYVVLAQENESKGNCLSCWLCKLNCLHDMYYICGLFDNKKEYSPFKIKKNVLFLKNEYIL